MIKGKTTYFFIQMIVLPIFIWMGVSSPLFAQDLHLSQQLASPIFINPANTANSDYDWRISDNYRTQWRSLGEPFITNIVSADKKIYLAHDIFGLGGLLIHDKSGDGKLTNFSVYLTASYQKTIREFKVRIGAGIGFVDKSFDISSLTFPEQYDRTQGGFNRQLSNQESFASNQINYMDVNWGLSVERRLNDKILLGIGLTNYHTNQAEESFFDINQNKKPSFYNYQLFGTYYLNSDREIIGFMNYNFESKASQLMLGADLKSNLDNHPQKIEYWLAGWYMRSGFNRNFDAVILKAGLGFKRIEAGVSYDFTLSPLRKVAAYRGALELSLILKGPSSLLKFNTIPCERL